MDGLAILEFREKDIPQGPRRGWGRKEAPLRPGAAVLKVDFLLSFLTVSHSWEEGEPPAIHLELQWPEHGKGRPAVMSPAEMSPGP